MATKRGGPLMRMRGLVGKELLQVLRDPSALAIAFVLPVMLLLLFGYGVSLDAEHVPIAMVIEKPTPDTTSLCGELEHSFYFEAVYVHGMPAARQALMERRVDAILHLREDFSEKLRRPGGAPVQLIVNGVDANTARIVNGYVEGAYATWLEHRSAETGQPLTALVDVKHRIWFNANVRSRNYLVPGVVAVVMTLIGALLTALLMAPRMGTRDDGSTDGHAGFDVGSIAGKDSALFHPGHGWVSAVGCHGRVAVRSAAAWFNLGAATRVDRCSC